jgi:hypothetical protein
VEPANSHGTVSMETPVVLDLTASCQRLLLLLLLLVAPELCLSAYARHGAASTLQRERKPHGGRAPC